MNRLFIEIARFSNWAAVTYPDKKYGEWECNYHDWDTIYVLFDAYIEKSPRSNWDNDAIQDILYILARDNESEWLADQIATKEDILLMLAEKAILSSETDAKWQLAARLCDCNNLEAAEQLMENFVQDPNEYVNRIALISLAKIKSSKTEYYCELAWNRDCDGEMQEYQRIAVLHALNIMDSNKLSHYIELAKQDGRKYLLKNALDIEANLR